MTYHGLTRLKRFISQCTSKLCNKLFCLLIFNVSCMRHLLYLIFRCNEKFGNFRGTKHSEASAHTVAEVGSREGAPSKWRTCAAVGMGPATEARAGGGSLCLWDTQGREARVILSFRVTIASLVPLVPAVSSAPWPTPAAAGDVYLSHSAI